VCLKVDNSDGPGCGEVVRDLEVVGVDVAKGSACSGTGNSDAILGLNASK
jgi:hypothetical protein